MQDRPAEPFVLVAELPPKRALALLTRKKRGANEPTNEALAELRREVESAFVDPSVLSVQRQVVGDGLAVDVVEVTGEARGIRLHHTTFLFGDADERYSLTFATEESSHQFLEPTFHEIAASLVLARPSAEDRQFLALVQAAQTNYEALQDLLDRGVDINGVVEKGFSPLGHAVLRRNGPLVRWLLERGADPAIPEATASMLPMIASPPIYELMAQRGVLDGSQRSSWTTQRPEGLEIEWVSSEAQLFAGIMNARLEDVREGLEGGARLDALEPSYRLPPLALVRRLMFEFSELGLDSSPLEPIESLLADAEAASGESRRSH